MSGGTKSESKFSSSIIKSISGWNIGITGVVFISIFNIVKLNRTKSKIVYPKSRDVKDPKRKGLAQKVEEIIKRTESLSNPKYVPTFWAANVWANTGLWLLKRTFDGHFRNNFARDLLTMEDGGTVSVDWPVEADNLPEDAPIVIFLHGLTASSKYSSVYTR